MNRSDPISPASPIETQRGTKVWWDDIKDYGFIRLDEDSIDFFAARTGLKMSTVSISAQRVVFPTIRGLRGPQEENVGQYPLRCPSFSPPDFQKNIRNSPSKIIVLISDRERDLVFPNYP